MKDFSGGFTNPNFKEEDISTPNTDIEMVQEFDGNNIEENEINTNSNENKINNIFSKHNEDNEEIEYVMNSMEKLRITHPESFDLVINTTKEIMDLVDWKGFTEEESRQLVRDSVGILKDAMTEAADTLAKTQNPQLSDFGLDLAYFKEMRACAQQLGGTSEDYIRLLIDCANLNSYVRSVRMGKSADFLKFALTEGGSIDPDVLLSRWPDTDVTDLYAGTALESASKFAGEAMGGWKITPFELACDNALTACLADTRYVPFGADAVVSYLASLDTEIMDLRMVLSGKICGISTEAIKERLRDVNV